MNFICIYSRVLFFPIQFLSSTAIVVYNNAFSITSSHIHEIPAFSRNLPRLRLGRKNLMPYLIQVLEALLKMPLFFFNFLLYFLFTVSVSCLFLFSFFPPSSSQNIFYYLIPLEICLEFMSSDEDGNTNCQRKYQKGQEFNNSPPH